ncbi:outer membrane beta-barrel protein [Flavobacterium sp. GT3R68]|uniref:outer membrane beta-barrel protein n=1 Tax=Flavobacterium sp. GT3R68 TaxID=2594437 RepID=UPI000F86F3FF|nr:outer membrane beta-barrel protein [Flavobacterium sp. GT3R68]RTY95958.1 PorT family protein [Flavobacterium sp. GSN2]TRW93730.1 PorT family protein [Flavobacterium sp. GT3R68]
MSERKNIDRLFQEKFKDFEVEPSEKVWKNIESKLKKKEDRKVIPFWLKLSGIAATLLIGFFTAESLLDMKKENPVVIQNKKAIDNRDLNSVKNNGIVTSAEASGAYKNLPSDSLSPISVPETNGTKTSVSTSSDDGVFQSGNSKTEKKLGLTPSGKTKNANSAVAESNSNAKTNNGINLAPSSKAIKNNQSVAERKSKLKDSSKKDRLKTILKSDKNNAIATADGKNSGKKNSRKKVLKSGNGIVLIADNLKDVKNPSDVTPDKKGQDVIDPVSDNRIQQNSDSKALDNGQPVVLENKEAEKKTDSVKVPNALEELLKEKEKKAVVAKEPKKDKWQISSSAAPVYYNSAGNGSPLDSVFKNNAKDYKTNLAYGVGLKYELNPKFSVRTGVSAVALEYNTNEIVFYQTKNAVSIKHVNYTTQGSIIQIENKNSNATPELTANDVNVAKFDGNLNQKTSYVEVPLELSYKLIDKKFGVEIIGGVSALFLNENKVTLVSPGMEMNMGEANNLNSTHFSTNIGLGLKYTFLKSFQLNFEPIFKYQLNTYTNDSGNFKPFFIGLYTGISYRF